MSPLTARHAMVLLVLGNLAGVLSDAFIKTLEGEVAIFQFVLFRLLAAAAFLLPLVLWFNPGHWRVGLKWHLLRAHILLLGAMCMVPAMTHLPIATAAALFHSAPLMMLPLAVLWYREKLSRAAIAAALVGFIGVLVVVRPTEINIGALAALLVAFSLACNNLLVRKLPRQHGVLQTLLLTNLFAIPVATLLAIWEGKPWDLAPAATAVGSSAMIMVYTGLCVVAYRAADSSKIASAEYTALIWAGLVGLLWFGERPDLPMVAGAVLIITPMWWLARQDRNSNRITDPEADPRPAQDV
ncbi:DMT family transporter [Ferrimonas balearica]|uniref:DMT family transporter n=1 Tax=Ferrimonas balearica TaxID=44012 RepID=UPI001C93B79E|nr:DMT family transporter [Ferrimonas balearica]MBY6226280.1 DMT family transporter [Ferrimonas balearica]